jgi:hypothetical protein
VEHEKEARGMTLHVVRDIPRNTFALVVNGDRISEFSTEQAAWEFAEDAYGVAQAATEMECSIADATVQELQRGEK